MQEWFKKAFDSTVDNLSKFSEKVQDSIEGYAFDEKHKKEYKESFSSIGDGFTQVVKGLTGLATSAAKTISEWLVPSSEKKKAKPSTTNTTKKSPTTKQ